MLQCTEILTYTYEHIDWHNIYTTITQPRRDRLQSENMVAELVYSFLLPEVEKETLRENVKREQRRHILAAHSVIHGQTSDIEKGTLTKSYMFRVVTQLPVLWRQNVEI